jgi:hypothetical protein
MLTVNPKKPIPDGVKRSYAVARYDRSYDGRRTLV